MKGPNTHRVIGASCPYEGCPEGVARVDCMVEAICLNGHWSHVRWLDGDSFVLDPVPNELDRLSGISVLPAEPRPWVRYLRAFAIGAGTAVAGFFFGLLILVMVITLLELLLEK